MAYKLEVREEEGYLCARASGQRNRDTVAALAREVVETCAKRGYDKVLVDVRELKGQMGVFDAYSIPAEHFPLLKQLGVLSKAVIVDSEERRERYLFFESVARGRGFNFRAFSETDSAVEWLRSDDDHF